MHMYLLCFCPEVQTGPRNINGGNHSAWLPYFSSWKQNVFTSIFAALGGERERRKRGGGGGATLPGCFQWIWSTTTFSCFIKCSVRRRWCHFIARHALPVLNLFIWTSCHSVFCVRLCIEYFFIKQNFHMNWQKNKQTVVIGENQ